jgi:hypothetical protein
VAFDWPHGTVDTRTKFAKSPEKTLDQNCPGRRERKLRVLGQHVVGGRLSMPGVVTGFVGSYIRTTLIDQELDVRPRQSGGAKRRTCDDPLAATPVLSPGGAAGLPEQSQPRQQSRNRDQQRRDVRLIDSGCSH